MTMQKPNQPAPDAEPTPGPWTVGGHDGALAVEAAPYGLIAAVRYLGNDPARIHEARRNAALMAAAPDLLDALRMVRASHVRIEGLWTAELAAIDAAIAKAEGR